MTETPMTASEAIQRYSLAVWRGERAMRKIHLRQALASKKYADVFVYCFVKALRAPLGVSFATLAVYGVVGYPKDERISQRLVLAHRWASRICRWWKL